MQVSMLYISATAAVVVVVAELAMRRRDRRHDVDKVGFMPWRGIALAALGIAFLAAALALHE
jgi:uncharacterized membrane protein YhiD involved in acid resistance